MSFGNGPFGNSPFGRFAWAKRMLWDYLPELHRQQDAEVGDNALQKLTAAQAYSFDRVHEQITKLNSLRNPLEVSTKYSDVRPLLLGKEILPPQKIEQRGVDGFVNSLGEFNSPTARFSEEDERKILELRRSSVGSNNIQCRITRILSATSVVTDPVLAMDAGKDRWELRAPTERVPGVVTVQVRQGDVSTIGPGYILHDGFSDYEVIARRQFNRSDDQKHLTEREGADGYLGTRQAIFVGSVASFGVVVDNGTPPNVPYDATFTSLVPGVPGNALTLSWYIKSTDPDGIEVRDNQVYEAGAWNPQIGNIGIRIGGTGPTVATFEAAFNATSKLAQVTTPGTEQSSTWVSNGAGEFNLPFAHGVLLFNTTAPSFTPKDIGKYLFIEGVDDLNPRRYIECVLTSSQVILNGDSTTSVGTQRKWALLPYPELDLAGNDVPKGTIEQEGVDLSSNGTAFSSQTLRMTAPDVGKRLAIKSPLVSTDTFVVGIIQSISTPVAGVQDISLPVATNMVWELRSTTDLDATSGSLFNTFVVVRAPSNLEFLTKDFGIATDTGETELYQRRWTKRINEWVDRKGTAKSYDDVAALTQSAIDTHPFDSTPISPTSFTANPKGLFAVSPPLFFEANFNFEGGFVGELVEGVRRLDEADLPLRSGTDGSIILLAGELAFFSPTAKFVVGDEERCLHLSGMTTNAAEVFAGIREYIDPNTVILENMCAVANGAIAPPIVDSANGAIDWAIGSLYVTEPPARLLGDDVDTDLMTEIVCAAFTAIAGAQLTDGETFTIDDGITPVVFEFDSNASVSGGHVAVPFTGGDTAAVVAASMITAINASASNVFAFHNSPSVVSLITPTATTLAETVADNTFRKLQTNMKIFGPDYLCKSPRFSARVVALNIIASSLIALNTYQVTVIGPSWFPNAPEVVKIIGNWFIEDSGAVEYFLESLPVDAGLDITSNQTKYTFLVKATSAPAVSRVVSAYFDYDCPFVLSCEFCASNKILIDRVTPGQATQRLLGRLNQTKPAHVDFIFRRP